jgi:hypothetical protein
MNAKNTQMDLNDHLFAQLERLGDESLDDAALAKEVERARAICGVSMQVIASGHLAVKAIETADGSFCKIKLPRFFGEIEPGEPKITNITTRKPLLERKDA